MMWKSKCKLLFITAVVLFSIIQYCGCIDFYERSSVDNILFSPDGSLLLSLDHEMTIQVWNITSGNEIYNFEPVDAGKMTWLPDGKRFAINILVATQTWRLIVYNSSHFEELWEGPAPSSMFATHNIGLVTTTFVGDNYKPKYNVTIWSASNYSKIKRLDIISMSSKISLSPIGTEIVYLPYTGDSLRIINIINESYNQSLEKINKNLSEIKYYNLHDLKISNDGGKIALLTNFQSDMEHLSYYLWDAADYSLIVNKTFPLLGGYAELSPDCTRFVYGNLNEEDVSIINASSGASLFTLPLSKRGVSSVDWSEDGSIIAAGSEDGIIKVWNATTGDLIQTMKTPKDHRVPT